MTEAINMVLTGMPGSGKSFLGRLMAAASGREFIDMDSHIEHTVGESIPDIIAGRGEEAFRELEVEAARELCRRSGLVIATGGGTVLRREGMEALRRNGCVFFVERPLARLALEGRPLSAGPGAVQRLYGARIGLYTRYADACILNDGNTSPEDMVSKALRDYELVCESMVFPR